MAKHLFTDADISALFKNTYGPISDETYNTMYPLMSQVRVVKGFEGTDKQVPVPLSFAGSVGAGTLPVANKALWKRYTLTSKRVYGRLDVDRETIYTARSSEGAFVTGTKEYVRKTVESYTRNAQRILFNPASQALGVVSTSGVSGSNPYVLTISTATWNESRFEEQDYVNIETGNTDLFEVTAVNPSLKQVTVQRLTGSQVPADGDEIFMQGSEDNEPFGIEHITSASSGSLYGIPVQRRWQSYQKAAGGATVSPALLNEAVLDMDRRTGKCPTHIALSYTQYAKLLDQMEDKKEFTMSPRDSRFKAVISYSGIALDTINGPIPLVPERFVDADKIYLLNFNYIERHEKDGFGWFDDDGSVFGRNQDDDSYEARYGGYWQNFIHPTFQGRISGLSV
jgi:hypothetical protein